MKSRWMWLLMAEDGGGAGGTGGGEPAGGAGGGNASGAAGGGKPGDDMAGLPGYFSQLSPDKRTSQEYRDALGRFAKLEDLADAYVDRERHKGDYIKRLSKDSSDEEVRTWAKEMGIPEGKDGYKFGDEDSLTAPEDKGALQAWKEIAWKNGLSGRQAEAAWAYVRGLGTVAAARQTKAVQTAKAALPGALADAYKAETSSDKEAQDKASAAQGYLARFMQATGSQARLEQSGIAYDPAFVKAVAAIMSTQDASLGGNMTVLGGEGKAGVGVFGDNYSESSRRVLGIK